MSSTDTTAAVETESTLPEGWATVVLGDIAELVSGAGFPLDLQGKRNLKYPFFKVGNLGDVDASTSLTIAPDTIDESFADTLHARVIPVGSVVFAKIGMAIRLNRRRLTGVPCCIDNNMMAAITNGATIPRYLQRYLETVDFMELAQTTTVPSIRKTKLQELLMPLPPLAEQKRIVAKVEELLARVSAARERLTRAPVILKRFRQAVLAAACSGRLTEDWREQNISAVQPADELLRKMRHLRQDRRAEQNGECEGRIATVKPAKPNPDFEAEVPEGWSISSMDELTMHITSGSRDWKRFYRADGSGTFVMAQNVRPLLFDRSYRLAVDPPDDRDRKRSAVREADLLVTIVGANTGDVCRVPDKVEQHYVCQSVALLRPILPEMSAFLEIYLNSPLHGQAQYQQWIYGEGRPHLSFDQLRETAVLVPPLQEQREIVRRVEVVFKLADTIEKHAAAATARAEKLTQTILAKAFRGELVPTEAELARRERRAYEPASELLARIQAAQQQTETPKRKNVATVRVKNG